MAKERLDVLVVERGLAESREKAQRLIRTGTVRMNGQPETKPGKQVPTDVELTVDEPERFVSRGGEKLLEAMEHFPIVLDQRICIDVGASTGGFTDCMLQYKAIHIYALDVGKGQLHWKLRQNDKVEVIDKFNARYMEPDQFNPKPSFASVDVSFISLTKILPALTAAMADEAELVTLIKPQFEAGREHIERGGVVRDPEVHEAVIENIRRFGNGLDGLEMIGVTPSPIKGPSGNIEFLAYWKWKAPV